VYSHACGCPQFLASDTVRAALNSSRSPLAALTVLKKICDHPYLLQKKAGAEGARAREEGEEETSLPPRKSRKKQTKKQISSP